MPCIIPPPRRDESAGLHHSAPERNIIAQQLRACSNEMPTTAVLPFSDGKKQTGTVSCFLRLALATASQVTRSSCQGDQQGVQPSARENGPMSSAESGKCFAVQTTLNNREKKMTSKSVFLAFEHLCRTPSHVRGRPVEARMIFRQVLGGPTRRPTTLSGGSMQPLKRS